MTLKLSLGVCATVLLAGTGCDTSGSESDALSLTGAYESVIGVTLEVYDSSEPVTRCKERLQIDVIQNGDALTGTGTSTMSQVTPQVPCPYLEPASVVVSGTALTDIAVAQLGITLTVTERGVTRSCQGTVSEAALAEGQKWLCEITADTREDDLCSTSPTLLCQFWPRFEFVRQ